MPLATESSDLFDGIVNFTADRASSPEYHRPLIPIPILAPTDLGG